MWLKYSNLPVSLENMLKLEQVFMKHYAPQYMLAPKDNLEIT